MPLPDRLRQLVATARFWSDYLGDEVFGEPVTDLPSDSYLELPLSPKHSLRIGYFWRASPGEDFISATDLRLLNKASGRETVLGWRWDDGHPHPHALRWEELDLIGQLQAVNDPESAHPGIPLLLLLPYVASIVGTDHALGLGLLNKALRSLGLFTEQQIRYRLSTFNRSPAATEWRCVHPYGWVCNTLGKNSLEGGGRRIYSLRQPPRSPSGNCPQFPFAEWNECMRHAERVVTAAGVTSPSQAMWEPVAPLASLTELHYQVTNCDAACETVPVLKRALFEHGLGVCYLIGSWTAVEDPEQAEAELAHPNAGDDLPHEKWTPS
jgi:hypothetical protein